jgi:hypothetical protein
LSAIAALEDCMRRGDHAGAVRLISRPETLAGIGELTFTTWQAKATDAYRESVVAWRAEHEATVQRQAARDIAWLVALVAEATGADRLLAEATALERALSPESAA